MIGRGGSSMSLRLCKCTAKSFIYSHRILRSHLPQCVSDIIFTKSKLRFLSGSTSASTSASGPGLSIWRRKKEMGKEGLIVAKELKRLLSHPVRLDPFIRSHVSRLLKSDLLAVLAEFQRQDQVFFCMKLYDVVRKEIWYRPDVHFYRDMLMMLARNKKVEKTRRVWEDLKREEALFDQHTFGDIIRTFLDSGLPSEAMDIYGNEVVS